MNTHTPAFPHPSEVRTEISPHTRSDIEPARHQLAEMMDNSYLSDLEFTRVLLGKALEISRSIAQRAQFSGARIHDPNLVALADRIAGVLDHTDPSLQSRGITAADLRYAELSSKVAPIATPSDETMNFTMAEKGVLSFQADDFSASIVPLPKDQGGAATLSVADREIGSFASPAAALREAHRQRDALRFKTTIADLCNLPFDTDLQGEGADVMALSKTSVGAYRVRNCQDDYEITRDDRPIARADTVADAVLTIKSDYVSQILK